MDPHVADGELGPSGRPRSAPAGARRIRPTSGPTGARVFRVRAVGTAGEEADDRRAPGPTSTWSTIPRPRSRAPAVPTGGAPSTPRVVQHRRGRVGRPRRATRAHGPRRVRLRRHLRRVRAAAGRRRLAGACPGTTGATATPSTPTSTPGRPTSATPSPCSTPSTDDPVPVLGHSKGGGADAGAGRRRCPHRVPPPRQPRRPAVASATGPTSPTTSARACCTASSTAGSTTAAAADTQRKPGTIDELAERRRPHEPAPADRVARYLVPVGGRQDADGWRWKIDPTLRLGGFGPWRPEWSMQRLPGIGVPVLGVLGLEIEVMGWGTRPEDVLPNLPAGRPVRGRSTGVGHFVHIEQPRRVADLVLDFLGAPRR